MNHLRYSPRLPAGGRRPFPGIPILIYCLLGIHTIFWDGIMMTVHRLRQSDWGSGPVRAAGRTVTALWHYRYTQAALGGAGPEAAVAEGTRLANEWTVTVSRADFARLPRLDECQPTCLQVGNWPEATVYFQGCEADDARHTLILRFTDRP
jgi:hypothetical protein